MEKCHFWNIQCHLVLFTFINIGKLKIDSSDLVKKLLKDTGVALTPGIDFDIVNGNKTIEFLFIRQEEFTFWISFSINGIKQTIETTTLVFFDHFLVNIATFAWLFELLIFVSDELNFFAFSKVFLLKLYSLNIFSSTFFVSLIGFLLFSFFSNKFELDSVLGLL